MSPEPMGPLAPESPAGPAVVVTCADDSRTTEEEEVVRRRGKNCQRHVSRLHAI